MPPCWSLWTTSGGESLQAHSFTMLQLETLAAYPPKSEIFISKTRKSQRSTDKSWLTCILIDGSSTAPDRVLCSMPSTHPFTFITWHIVGNIPLMPSKWRKIQMVCKQWHAVFNTCTARKRLVLHTPYLNNFFRTKGSNTRRWSYLSIPNARVGASTDQGKLGWGFFQKNRWNVDVICEKRRVYF